MLFFFVITVYVICLCHLFIYEGPRLPAIYAVLWVAGFFCVQFFGGSSGMVFVAYQAILCVIMQLTLKIRNPGYRP